MIGQYGILTVEIARDLAQERLLEVIKGEDPSAERKAARSAFGQDAAARTVTMLHAIFEHGIRMGITEANPVRGVRKAASVPRDRRLSIEEIKTLGVVLNRLQDEGENPTALAASRFIALTGFRRSEALLLQVARVADDYRCVRFPDTKTGKQTRVIGEAARQLIRRQVKRNSQRYVFPADVGEGNFIGLLRVLDRVLRAAKIAGVSLHTLRHTLASLAAELGFSELTIAGLLGHASRGVTQRYAHIDEALVMAANKTWLRIEELLGSKIVDRA